MCLDLALLRSTLCPFEIILLGKREFYIRTKDEVVTVMFKPSSDLFCLTVLRQCFLWILFVIHVSNCLCFAVLSVPCSLVISCWERANLLVLFCVCVTIPYCVLGQVWYLFVTIHDLCLPLVVLFLLPSKSSKT